MSNDNEAVKSGPGDAHEQQSFHALALRAWDCLRGRLFRLFMLPNKPVPRNVDGSCSPNLDRSMNRH